MTEQQTLAEEVAKRLVERGWTISVGELDTGGLLARYLEGAVHHQGDVRGMLNFCAPFSIGPGHGHQVVGQPGLTRDKTP